MISRFNYKPIKKRDSSNDDIFYEYKYCKKMRVLSTDKDGAVDKYTEESYWKQEKSSWSDFMKSFSIGSVAQQVMDHLTKGTPLMTAHTLPAGTDYTNLERGAEIKREMAEKGLTIDMVVQAVKESMKQEQVVKQEQQVQEGN